MHILHTIAGLDKHSGGTSTCTYDLLSALHKLGCKGIDVVTPESDDMIGKGESWIKTIKADGISPYSYSPALKAFLRDSDYDLYHTNGLWLYCNHITCSAARKKRKPYVISPHGMLYPAALHRSYWKKWPLILLFFRKDIQRVTCIHTTCKEEMRHVREFGYKGPVAIIPNPANLPDYLDEIASNKGAFLGCKRPRKLGFLGRLHPRKQVENLLSGVRLLPKEYPTELVIMGKGDEAYEQFLRAEAKRLGLSNVTFAGFVTGREKYERLAELSALFVPSDFENFGMIVTEALSVGTPVMASLGTPWEDLNFRHCGWWTDRSPEKIAEVMAQVIDMPVDELLAMGERGKQLVAEKYVDTQVASMMRRLYEWILNGGEKPEFVYD
ncbi:MAG: glycosyltransferase [Prevotellaceae bacterium]|nr:glycosyltransferase [Prevotellaceae bacterium]